MKKKLSSIEMVMIKRIKEARKSYIYFMNVNCHRFAFESAIRFQENVRYLYLMDTINYLQYRLLVNMGEKMYRTALDGTYKN